MVRYHHCIDHGHIHMEHECQLAQDFLREEYRRVPRLLFSHDIRVRDRIRHGLIRAHQERETQTKEARTPHGIRTTANTATTTTTTTNLRSTRSAQSQQLNNQ